MQHHQFEHRKQQSENTTWQRAGDPSQTESVYLIRAITYRSQQGGKIEGVII